MGPDEVHPQVLRELTNVIALLIIFEWSWLLEVSEDWRKENFTSVSKKGKKEYPGLMV